MVYGLECNLAPVFVVIARWFMDLNVISIIFGVLCTALTTYVLCTALITKSAVFRAFCAVN